MTVSIINIDNLVLVVILVFEWLLLSDYSYKSKDLMLFFANWKTTSFCICKLPITDFVNVVFT